MSNEGIAIHGDAGATEANTEEDGGGRQRTRAGTGAAAEFQATESNLNARFRISRGREPSVNGSLVEIETDVGGFRDVALEKGLFGSVVGSGCVGGGVAGSITGGVVGVVIRDIIRNRRVARGRTKVDNAE